MKNSFSVKWKQSLFVWSFSFLKKFISKTFNKAYSSFSLYFKKFWYLFLAFITVIVSLFATFFNIHSVINIKFISCMKTNCLVEVFQASINRQLNPTILAFLLIVMIILFFTNIFLPFIITKENYDEKEYNYLKFFKSKLFGFLVKLPILWWIIFSILFFASSTLINFNFYFLGSFLAIFLLLLINAVAYSIYLYSDSPNNKAFSSIKVSLKLFIYNLPAFIFFKLVYFLINSIVFTVFLGCSLLFFALLYFLLHFINFLFIFILAIIFIYFAFLFMYFIGLSVFNNFYLTLKEENLDIIKLEKL